MKEKRKLFCLYYLQTFQIAKAEKMAGYTPNYGYQLLKQPEVQQEIDRLKKELTRQLMVEAEDVLNKYIQIAFADITDYCHFGHREKTGNYIKLKSSDAVDGRILEEISVSSTTTRVKLMDRFKALEKLEKYYDLMGESRWKKYIEEKKLSAGGETQIIVDTGIRREDEEEKIE